MADALRLGTRGSALALAQAGSVGRALEAYGVVVEVVTIRTSGDEPAPPLADPGDIAAATGPARAVEDKARFVKELEQALLAGEIDLAVHSAKDVPGELPEGLEIVAVPERADARDALCLAPRHAESARAADPTRAADPDAPPRHSIAARPLDVLPDGAVVGTASLRRRAELLALRPDLDVRELRGNVDTRLRRLAEAGPADAPLAAGAGIDAARAVGSAGTRPLDAIVLATAGLARLGRSEAGTPLPEHAFVPAAGQGCLALQARAGDEATRKLASRLTDPHAFACLTAERTLVTALGATCHTPVGAHAMITNHASIQLAAFVGTPDGARWIRDDVRGMAEDPQSIGHDAANRLTAAGAADILAAAENDG